MKRKRSDGDDDPPTAIDSSSSEGINSDPVLESRHKIFPRQSGFQRESLDHLCKAFEERLSLCSSSEGINSDAVLESRHKIFLRHNGFQKEHAMKPKIFDGDDDPPTAIDPSSSDAINDDPVLESRHKIFLSHSGVQKEFVDHLCKALEERCRYPFFDRRHHSLPKGQKFPGLIIKAAQQCQLLVVVVSDEYFMSKWPMIELNAFVNALKEMKSNMNLGILPLFYKLSVSELKDEKRRQTWFEEWETFARADSKGLIKVDDWKYALDELTKFNGLSYNQESKQAVEFEKEIVSYISQLVPANIKFEDSHVQGNAHKVVEEKMKQVGVSDFYKVIVFGLYGVGGIGKTTTCQRLCNELLDEFEGRVCHIELDSTSSNSKKLFEKVLMKLTRISGEDFQKWDEGEYENALRQNLLKQKTFLAIDNVWDDGNSIKLAHKFLQAPSHPDSLILVTTRGQTTLELLRVDAVARLEMPELGEGDARNLFLHYAANGQQFTSEEDMGSIGTCIRRCYFSKGDGEGFHYHPLALEVLGRQLGGLGKNPSEWEDKLPSVSYFNGFSGVNMVFGVLRSSFDLLQPSDQALFMDVALFLHHLDENRVDFRNPILWSKRLCSQYKKDEQQMQILLDSLKGKGLLQDVNLSLGKVNMHDLYREFAMLEAKGKFVEEESIENQRWVYVDVLVGDISKVEVTPDGQCWQKLTRLSICEDDFDPIDGLIKPIIHPIESLANIEWRHFPNVLVLQLYGLKSVKGTLNLKDMKRLRSLQIHDLSSLERLEGLEGLTNLTLFEWSSTSIYDGCGPKLIVGQFPRSLLHVDIHGKCTLSGLDALAQCNKLCKLLLVGVEVGIQLNLSKCLSLEQVVLSQIDNLQTLLLPSIGMAFRLQSLHVEICTELVDVQGLDRLVSLEFLQLNLHQFGVVPNLLSLTKLQTLKTYGEINSIGLHIPHQLQEFQYTTGWGSIKAPNLNGFNQLQVLDLSMNYDLTYMSEMGDLPALRSLNLSSCYMLRRLLDLRKSTNLQELDLNNCSNLELHEEDIQSLATLPLLNPVHFSSWFERGRIKLDLGNKNKLRYVGTSPLPPKSWKNWMKDEWKVEELGQPPIKQPPM